MAQTTEEVTKPQQSFIRRLFASKNKFSPPPPYTNHQIQSQGPKKRRIRAADVPQWKWSNDQCREWSEYSPSC